MTMTPEQARDPYESSKAMEARAELEAAADRLSRSSAKFVRLAAKLEAAQAERRRLEA